MKGPSSFYEKIAAFAKEHLAPNGMVWVETHENLAAQVCELFRMQGFESGIEKDVFGKRQDGLGYSDPVTVADVVAPSRRATFITRTISPTGPRNRH